VGAYLYVMPEDPNALRSELNQIWKSGIPPTSPLENLWESRLDKAVSWESPGMYDKDFNVWRNYNRKKRDLTKEREKKRNRKRMLRMEEQHERDSLSHHFSVPLQSDFLEQQDVRPNSTITGIIRSAMFQHRFAEIRDKTARIKLTQTPKPSGVRLSFKKHSLERQIAQLAGKYMRHAHPVDIIYDAKLEGMEELNEQIGSRFRLMGMDWQIYNTWNEGRDRVLKAYVLDADKIRSGAYDGRIPKGSTVIAVKSSARASKLSIRVVIMNLFLGIMTSSKHQEAGPERVRDWTHLMQGALGINLSGEDLTLIRFYEGAVSVQAALSNVVPRFKLSDILKKEMDLLKMIGSFA
jgi:hypothetical protein